MLNKPGPLTGTTGSEKSLQQLHVKFEHEQYLFGVVCRSLRNSFEVDFCSSDFHLASFLASELQIHKQV